MAAQITALLQGGEQTAAAELTHRMRGAAANLALLPLSHLAGQLEQVLKGPIPVFPKALLDALQQALANLSAELPERPITALDKPVVDTVELLQLRPLIEQSRIALHHGELAEQALQQLLAALPVERAQALEAAINDFSFEHAAAQLAELLGWLEQQPGGTAP